MKILSIAFFLLLSFSGFSQKSKIAAKNAEIEKAGTGYAFTEGPAVAPTEKFILPTSPTTGFMCGMKKKAFRCGWKAPAVPTECILIIRGNWLPVPICTISLAGSMKTKSFISFTKGTTGNCLTPPTTCGLPPMAVFIFLIRITTVIGGMKGAAKNRMCEVFIT